MSWSRVVGSPGQARAALAAPGDALDLRAVAALDREWAEMGFRELTPGIPAPSELVLAVPQRLRSVAQTRALGARLAGRLRPGDLVVLSGPLGAGKTALTQGIGAALGVRGAVTSPTFVLVRIHQGPVPLQHVDAYRLREAGAGPDAVDDLDLDSELPYCVTVVEWGEGLVEGLAESRLHVTLSRDAQDSDNDAEVDAAGSRLAEVRPHGPRWAVNA